MTRVRGRAVMRDHSVHERASTPLELFFDLCFVVAVAFLAVELHHGIAEQHTVSALVTYLALFVPVWWAWMSYTWFATAFSHDDATTRVLTLAQMGGILAVAAAVPAAARGDLVPFAVAYAVMRLPLVVQWLRSAVADPAHRAFALTYAVGSVAAQLLWVLGALAGGAIRVAVFAVALAVELATPVLAVRRSPDRVFHPRHIAERYGLFTIIVLGETVLAVSTGLARVVDTHSLDPVVLTVVGCALVIAFCLWWLYFGALGTDALERNRRAAFVWGYGHYAIFAAVAAVGAATQAVVEAVAAPAGNGAGVAGARVVVVAVAVVLLTLDLLRRTASPGPLDRLVLLAVAALLVLAVATPLLGPLGTLAAATVVTAALVPARG